MKRNRMENARRNPYATREDFRKVFAEHAEDLYLFSFLLTGDAETAHRCFVAGLKDSSETGSVFQEWADSWAKRTIVQNAIRALHPRPGSGNSILPAAVNGKLPETVNGPIEMGSVLAMRDFERFVFVLTVLERYSEKRCSLLLDCTVPEIRAARTRAVAQVIKSSNVGVMQAASA